MRRRVDKTEYQNRLDVVMSLRVRGLPSSQIVKAVSKQWEISDRHARRYLKAAKEQASRQMDETSSEQFGDLMDELKFIYQQAIQNGDLELAKRTVVERALLFEKKQKALSNESIQSKKLTNAGQKELEKFLQSFEEAEASEPSGDGECTD